MFGWGLKGLLGLRFCDPISWQTSSLRLSLHTTLQIIRNIPKFGSSVCLPPSGPLRDTPPRWPHWSCIHINSECGPNIHCRETSIGITKRTCLGFIIFLETWFLTSPRAGLTFGLQPVLICKADLCSKNRDQSAFLFVQKAVLVALKPLV